MCSSDLKLDMANVVDSDKAGAGNFGTSGDGMIKNRTGATPRVDSGNGDFLELLIQDDLTPLISAFLKGQGHLEGA